MSGGQKKYGLSIPRARLGRGGRAGASAHIKPKLGLFAQAEEEDEEEGGNVESQIAAQQRHAHSIAKNEDVYKAALAQDPTVFDYDEVYETMNTGKEEKDREEKLNRKSRYIADLKAKAAEREREQTMVYERKMVREVEKEEHLYGEKEKFVTSSYRKKLEEEKLWHEREKLRDEEERRNDVTKKRGLGDFYSNLLTKNVAFGNAKPEDPSFSRPEPAAQEREATREAEAPRTSPPPPPPGEAGPPSPSAEALEGPPPARPGGGGPDSAEGGATKARDAAKEKATVSRSEKINAALLRYRKRKAGQM